MVLILFCANASAKVINSTTNLAALTFFIPQGHVVWAWAIPLALANLCGGVVGACLAMRGGTKLLRYGFMLLLCLTMESLLGIYWLISNEKGRLNVSDGLCVLQFNRMLACFVEHDIRPAFLC